MKKPLGRGLDSLIPKSYLGGRTLVTVDINAIIPSPLQPRKQFDEAELASLAHTIQEHGLIQPIVVRRLQDQYEIIAGERRWRACKRINLTPVPVIIKDSPDDVVLKIALIENMHRESLNPLDIAAGYQQLIDAFAMTHTELATLFGKSRSAISNTCRLLSLVSDAQAALRNKQLSEGHARVLAGLSDAQQRTVLDHIIQNNLTVRQTEALVRSPKPVMPKPKTSDESLKIYARKKSESLPVTLAIKGTKSKGQFVLKYTSEAQREQLEAWLDQF